MTPELLSPAGSPEALRAAVQNGAGAVYLGWGAFNARRSARNFSREEFAEALAYCHVRGVRVFLTLNTLVTDRELPQAAELAAQAGALGVDAVLVQDWGLFDLLRRTQPDLPLHASTQMSVFTTGGARLLREDGCERVVLARELSKNQIDTIRRGSGAETEIFAHGALCVCCSGQCAMSAVVGGRSGNRGRCAQPCRLPYGVNEPAGSERPLSMKDMSLADHIPEINGLQIDCVKLEGRMKRPEYVAVVTRIYAKLLAENRGPTAAESRELERAFSRSGFTDGYWRGRTGGEMFGVRPENTPEPEDLFAAARASYEKDGLRTVPVTMNCLLREGEPAALTVSDGKRTLTVTGPVPETARSRPLTEEEVSARLQKTGGTPYRCAAPAVRLDPGLRLSAGALNDLRRRALEDLTAARTAVPQRRRLPDLPPVENTCSAPEPRFTVSVTREDQIAPLLPLDPARICVPLELLADFSALPETDARWLAILPRVWRDEDEPELRRMLEKARSLGVTGALAGTIGALPLIAGAGLEICGDFGLNVFNARSLDYLRRKGLSSACLSFELRLSQIRDMAKPIPTEALVYGRLPLMITENCLLKKSVGCRCEKRNVLRDRTGAEYLLLPAWGHRMEIENDRPLWLADRTDYRKAGLAYARLRFTDETPEECERVLRAYMAGNGAPPASFTRGLYDRGVE